MLLWSFLLFWLYERADSIRATNLNSSFALEIDGKSVVLAGETVQLTCYGMHDIGWYRLDRATGIYHMVKGLLNHFLTFNATVENSGEYMCSNQSIKTYYSALINLTIVEKISPLQVVATPGYQIAMEGQTVTMHCNASTLPPTVIWSWYRLEDEGGWQMVGNSTDLTLTKAEESGKYRCYAQSQEQGIWQEETSPDHTVYIISLPASAGENLGIAALCFSLLALIVLFAILLWLGRQRANQGAALQALTIPDSMAKGFAGPEKAQEGDVPKSEGEGEVYMNYTNTNQVYTDMVPAYMTADDVYSSLS